MKRFVEGEDRGQGTLFPECLEGWVGEDNPSRVTEEFVDGLDLAELGFNLVQPCATGWMRKNGPLPSPCGHEIPTGSNLARISATHIIQGSKI